MTAIIFEHRNLKGANIFLNIYSIPEKNVGETFLKPKYLSESVYICS